MDCIYFVEIKCWKIIIVWNYEIFVWKSGDRDIVIKLFLNYMSHRNTNVKYCQINNSKKCYETVPDVLHFWRCKFFSGWKSHNSGVGYGDGLGCLWKIFTCLLCLQIKMKMFRKKSGFPRTFLIFLRMRLFFYTFLSIVMCLRTGYFKPQLLNSQVPFQAKISNDKLCI